MTDPVDRDRQVEDLLRQSMPAGRPASLRCVDAEQLAAWSAGALRREDAATVERHLADCADCQAMLAAFVESEPVPGVATVPFWQRWSMRWLVPVAAASAAVVLWTVVTREQVAVPEAATTMARAEPESQARFQAPIDEPPAAPQMRPAPAPAPPVPSAAAPSASDAAAASAEQRSREMMAAASQAGATRAVGDMAMAGQSAAARESAPETTSPQLARAEPLPAPPPPAAAAPAPPPPPPPAGGTQVTSAAPTPPAQGARSATVSVPQGRQNNLTMDGISVMDTAVPLHARVGAVPTRFGAVSSAVRWTIHADGRVERSRDLGLTWNPLASVAATRILAGSAPAADVCWLVGRDGVVWRSTDGSTFVRRPFPLTAALVTVVAEDAARAVVTTDDGRVFATVDGGTTWQGRP